MRRSYDWTARDGVACWLEDYSTVSGQVEGADRGLGALRGRRQAVEQRRRVSVHHLRILGEGLLAAPFGDDGIGEPAQEADDAGRVADPTGVLMQRDIEDVVQGLDPPVGPDPPSILARCQCAAADVVVHRGDDPILGDAGALNAAQAADILDRGRAGHPGDNLRGGDRSSAARLVASVAAVPGPMRVSRRLVECRRHPLQQGRLIARHGDQVIALALAYRRRHGRRGRRRVDRNELAG